ncbi:hypothetical protein FRC01_012562 [Tulasnella sp. 417]|nr:hypothetical protein FRC01_012562 [Tulasnella sp. 417]
MFANILFLFAWAFVTLSNNTYPTGGTLLGKKFWTDFSVYAGVSACLPLFSFIGLLREGAIVSHLWFEATWLLLVSAFDGYLIWRQKEFWPPFKSYADYYFNDPWLTISIVSYVLTVIGLVADLCLSLFWCGVLGKIVFQNRSQLPAILFSEVQDFPWLKKELSNQSLVERIIGVPRQNPPRKSIPEGLKRWFLGSTMFRRFDPIEPLTHSVARGVLATAFWVVLIAYAILNCVINPVRQFTLPKGLPSNFLLQDSRDTVTFGHINGFIALNVTLISELSPGSDGWYYPDEMCNNIAGGIRASVRNPLSGEAIDCLVNCGGNPLWIGESQDFLQIEALWDCGNIWDNLKFRTSSPIPDSRPYVSVTWNSSAYPAKPVLNAGLGNIRVIPDEVVFDSVVGGTSTPREWKGGVTFNFTAGQNLRVDVGRRRYYSNRATFLDLMGITQSPNVFVTYPILSLTPDSAPVEPPLTVLTFYPGFSAYNDELYEEYLNFTIISGLSTTGGLYSAFDVVFILIFGRSLLTALFGGKQVTPFGAIASLLRRDKFRQDLLKKYPGIDDETSLQRADSTCKFLHDFILDLKPLEIPRPKESEEFGKDSNQADANPEVTDDQRGSEVDQRITRDSVDQLA